MGSWLPAGWKRTQNWVFKGQKEVEAQKHIPLAMRASLLTPPLIRTSSSNWKHCVITRLLFPPQSSRSCHNSPFTSQQRPFSLLSMAEQTVILHISPHWLVERPHPRSSKGSWALPVPHVHVTPLHLPSAGHTTGAAVSSRRHLTWLLPPPVKLGGFHKRRPSVRTRYLTAVSSRQLSCHTRPPIYSHTFTHA